MRNLSKFNREKGGQNCAVNGISVQPDRWLKSFLQCQSLPFSRLIIEQDLIYVDYYDTRYKYYYKYALWTNILVYNAYLCWVLNSWAQSFKACVAHRLLKVGNVNKPRTGPQQTATTIKSVRYVLDRDVISLYHTIHAWTIPSQDSWGQ